ncbi:MAG: hypothetical protein Q4G52_06480 [Clostridia bacterium]|nr:hypothetical protein [Clostridia bacterium]
MLIWVGIVYLALSLPVTVNLSMSVNERQSTVRASLFALGLGARFDALLARRGFSLSLNPRYGQKRGHKKKPRVRAIKTLEPILRAALMQVDVRRFDLDLRVGLREADHTALTAGALRFAATALLARLPMPKPCRINVQPSFDGACFLMTAHCIFRAMPGDIIFAALKAAIKTTRKEGFGWISSIPLRA